MATVSVHCRDLTDAQWEILNTLIPESAPHRHGRGRPWKDRRAVLNGILWVLRTGAPWADVPDRYPSYQTCHRRFQQWVRSGIMKGVLETLALCLEAARGALDVREAFIDGSFAPAKKGAPKSKKKRGAEGSARLDSPGWTGASGSYSAEFIDAIGNLTPGDSTPEIQGLNDANILMGAGCRDRLILQSVRE